ncbi:MAG: PAS domain-containing protein [Ferruginibacter sp.]|nr:PAS domain-containing protein [Cytophagales bacterium]
MRTTLSNWPVTEHPFGQPFEHLSEKHPGKSPASEMVFRNGGDDEALSLRLIEKLFPAWVIVQCDNQHRIQFISANSAEFFGYSPGELKRKRFDDFLAHLHPEDLSPYLRVRQKTEDVLSNLEVYEIPEYRFVLNYRLRRGDGTYFHLHVERIFLPISPSEYDSFILFKDVTGEKPFGQVQLEWYRSLNGAYRKIGSYAPLGAAQRLTHREIEVLQLIKEGRSSKEIAGKLFISINTVRNHRSRLFEKTGAKNMVDLLNAVDTLVPAESLLN